MYEYVTMKPIILYSVYTRKKRKGKQSRDVGGLVSTVFLGTMFMNAEA